MVEAVVSGCLWASTRSSSVTKNRRAASPNDKTVSTTTSEALLRMSDPNIAPTTIKEEIPEMIERSFNRERIISDNSIETIMPKERSSRVIAIARSKPSFAPAAKPIPIKKPSNRTSTETPMSIAKGKEAPSRGFDSKFEVPIFKIIMVATPRANPRMTKSGLWTLITSGKISTATTEKTTPAVKCCMKFCNLYPGFRKRAPAEPIIVAKTGGKVKRKILSKIHLISKIVAQ